ncbi:helix-turn-helix transcriptional regulator [Clostridioides sp. ZZV15-6383]|uniref:winged helix-turn-helix transcriptional regulator n=1 Tax=unclassified Clostridioides TaxID=2635829 RepID=UPI0006BBAA5B|nr:transcriptional regulator [Clostridioides difficile]MCC0685204.1 helix-turn-helix transcriptional regulator [Clostridioides sp. ZZV14-6345]MCC0699969.1 helix-turn-helix transcriptional regulator [Clostridioides sp. ZZV15-6383]
MKIRDEYTCPLEIVHDIIKGKWKTILVFELRQSNRTFSELEHGIYGINQKMLIQQLKELREFGIIDKISSVGYPLHVEYFLTNRGKKMLKAVEIMQEIGIEYMLEHGQQEILDSRGICYNK